MYVAEVRQPSSGFDELWDSFNDCTTPWPYGRRNGSMRSSGNMLVISDHTLLNINGYLLENFVRPRTQDLQSTIRAFGESLDGHSLEFPTAKEKLSYNKHGVVNSAVESVTSIFHNLLVKFRPDVGSMNNEKDLDCSGDNDSTLAVCIKPEIVFGDLSSSDSKWSKVSPSIDDNNMHKRQKQPRRRHAASTNLCQKSIPVNQNRDLVPMPQIDYSFVRFSTIVDLGRVVHNTARYPEPAHFHNLLTLVNASDNAPVTLFLNVPQTKIMRVRHLRPHLDEEVKALGIFDPHGRIEYERNRNFRVELPYEPEFVRYEVDPVTNLPVNHTRHGLCAYCSEIHFYHFKTLAYGQHLALFHGIYPSNFIAPDPLYGGIYRLRKLNAQNLGRKRTAHEHIRPGVVCPACYEVLECDCTKTTKLDERPLTKYLRHFRDCHIKVQRCGSPYMLFRDIKFEDGSMLAIQDTSAEE